MFHWFDLLLAAVVVWETITGFLYGPKLAGVRVCAVFSALMLALPFTANCAAYLRPVAEPIFLDAIGERVVAVSSGHGTLGFLGPWQSVLGLPVSTGTLYIQRVLSLAVNVTALSFLILVVHLTVRLLQMQKNVSEPTRVGALVGFTAGLLIIIVFLVLAPVLALAETGMLLSTALEESGIVRALYPLTKKLIHLVAPFVS